MNKIIRGISFVQITAGDNKLYGLDRSGDVWVLDYSYIPAVWKELAMPEIITES